MANTPRFKPHEAEAIDTLAMKGFGPAVIAMELECQPKSISTFMQFHDKNGVWKDAGKAATVQIYTGPDEPSIDKTAAFLGWSRVTVHAWLREAGVTRPSCRYKRQRANIPHEQTAMSIFLSSKW